MIKILTNYILRITYKYITILLRLFIKPDNTYVSITGLIGEVFEGNSMYFFKYLYSKSDYNVYWFVKNKSEYLRLREKYHNNIQFYYSISALFVFIKSKFIFCSYSSKNFNPLFICSDQVCINLGHGTPLKRIAYLDPQLNRIQLKKLKEDLEKTDYFIANSEFEAKIFCNIYRKKIDNIWITGTPRNDYLLSDSGESSFLSKNKIILYAPTFRKGEKTNLLPFNDLDFKKLDSFLEKNNYYLLIRKHHNEMYRYKDIYRKNKISNRIVLAGQDIYPDSHEILKYTDVLLTDYSSIYIDFLLLDRPMAFLPFDYEKYKREKGFLYDYNENTPGPKIHTQNELFSFLQEIFNGEDAYKEYRTTMKSKFHKYTDGQANKRILKRMNKIL